MYYDFLTEQFQTLHSLDLNDLSAMYRKTARGNWLVVAHQLHLCLY